MMAQVELDIKAQIKELQKGLKTTQSQLKDLQKQSDKTNQKMQKNVDSSSKTVQKLAGHLKTLLTIGAFVQLARNMINVRKEFEKYEAMLRVALGSAKAANKEFEKIKTFAAETPFSVRELTDSFVKLVNQGFRPTMKEMQAMGDLAAAMGKDFGQLAEAIIDAQVGEFERLKEFGIRASKEGNNVSLSFKGVEKQVEFTASAIQQAIIGFGQMEGVMGTMDEISKTLGGRISNMNDAWDSLMNTMGERTSGVLSNVISGLTEMIGKVEDLLILSEAGLSGKERAKGIIRSYIVGEDEDTGELVYDISAINTELEYFKKELEDFKMAAELAAPVWAELAPEKLVDLDNNRLKLEAIVETLQEFVDTTDESTGVKKEEAKTIKDIQEEIKKYQDALENTLVLDNAERERIENEIASRKELIKTIKEQKEALRKLIEAQEEDSLGLEGWMQTEFGVIENVIGKYIDGETIIEGMQEDAFQKNKERLEREAEDAERRKERKEQIQEGTFQALQSGADAAFAYQQMKLDQQMQEELQAAGDNEKKKEEIRKEYAKKEQRNSVLQAIINGALGITKTAADLGYPVAIPFQIALALQTLAQIATIKSQKFERGGYDVLKGKRHYQGGIPIGIGEAEDGEGVAVFSRQATQKYGKFLPAFVKAMNENEATITGYGDNAYNIHMDDSRQVNKLEDIRKLLAKEEIIFQNGYKIIKRSGHTTRVKI